MSATRRRISLSRTDYKFIVNYDPEQEPTASRQDLIAVLEHIRVAITTGAELEQGRPEQPRERRHGMPHALHLEDIARWEARFRQDAPTGAPDDCWLWQGRLDKNGYATLSVRDAGRGRDLRPHRMAWVFATGQSIPEGLSIDHLCQTKSCLNPAHLEVVTPAENTRRKPLRKREKSWGNPANQRTCATCGSVFHHSYIAYHACR